MRKISNKRLLNIVTKLLFLALLTKAISLVVWWYLPSDGVELKENKNYQPKYQRVDFRAMLEKSEEKK